MDDVLTASREFNSYRSQIPPKEHASIVRCEANDARQMTTILYLDYDGVLHDDAVYWSPKQGIFINTPGRTLFEWMPILEELLFPYPDVKIVLSTSWVRVKSFRFAKEHLSPSLQARVVGATYHHREMRRHEFEYLPRGVQVWEDVVRRKPTAWFALDNDEFGWPEWCRGNLVKTEDHLGLSDESVQEEIRNLLKRLWNR